MHTAALYKEDKDHFPTKTFLLFTHEKNTDAFAWLFFFTSTTIIMHNNNERNNDDNEEIEFINVRCEGISYNELIELQKFSMLTLANMSKVLPTVPTPTPTPTPTLTPTHITPQTIYSSNEVKISKTNNNYLIPYHPFK